MSVTVWRLSDTGGFALFPSPFAKDCQWVVVPFKDEDVGPVESLGAVDPRDCPMPLIDSDTLVKLVAALGGAEEPVAARRVLAWCRDNGIDFQGPGRNYQAFWDADVNEAKTQHRLLKFKRGDKRQSRGGWALAGNAKTVRAAAATSGWRELLWNGEKWVWDDESGGD